MQYDADGGGACAPVDRHVYRRQRRQPLVVTFTSVDATPAAVEALIRQIAYQNTNTTDPDGTATVRFTVNDGDGGHSGTATSPSASRAVNDEPTLAATAVNPIFTEGGAAADIFSGVTASTIEAGQNFTSMTLTVSNVTDGASEILNFDGSPIALTDGNSPSPPQRADSHRHGRGRHRDADLLRRNAERGAAAGAGRRASPTATPARIPTGANRVVTITAAGRLRREWRRGRQHRGARHRLDRQRQPVNDEPTLTATAVDPTFTEGGAAVDLFRQRRRPRRSRPARPSPR